ncbi:hypothetical protein [Nitrososphaera sp. AFS]|uniref:hypothetical protein n=1 Tax=Nitrososphaera sp. AFS TaxID=2301191 RepID=UPI0013923386|nr:hypothetical protein [Nitrososphaera sp. AFS]NAL78407.1 hypothetical protein [Nitrososphaera sp. AFS]
MTHPKTIEAYDSLTGNQAGDYKRRFGKGNDVIIESKKALIEKDPNKQTKVLAVHRLRLEDNSEYILWQEEIIGHSGIGNEIKYELGWSDLCYWLEPIPRKEIKYNPQTEQNEVIERVDDLSQMKVHYLYPFNKENINLIKDKIKSNPRCPFYVKDVQGMTRTVTRGFSEWKDKPFEWLIEFT